MHHLLYIMRLRVRSINILNILRFYCNAILKLICINFYYSFVCAEYYMCY